MVDKKDLGKLVAIFGGLYLLSRLRQQPAVTLEFEVYDADIPNEVTVYVNNQKVLSYPPAPAPENDQKWIQMTVDISGHVRSGENSITIANENTTVQGATIILRNIVVKVNGTPTYTHAEEYRIVQGSSFPFTIVL